jgi:hypothetical protein
MLQIHNLKATVGEKPILTGLALSLWLAGCSEAPAKGEDCTALANQRSRDVGALMDEYRPLLPRAKSADANGYPLLKDVKNYREFQDRLERIETRYQAQCGGKK